MTLGRLYGSSIAGVIPGSVIGNRTNEAATMRQLGYLANSQTSFYKPSYTVSTPYSPTTPTQTNSYAPSSPQFEDYAEEPKSHSPVMRLWRKMTGGDVKIQWLPYFKYEYEPA